jgi:hypothetical protein
MINSFSPFIIKICFSYCKPKEIVKSISGLLQNIQNIKNIQNIQNILYINNNKNNNENSKNKTILNKSMISIIETNIDCKIVHIHNIHDDIGNTDLEKTEEKCKQKIQKMILPGYMDHNPEIEASRNYIH